MTSIEGRLSTYPVPIPPSTPKTFPSFPSTNDESLKPLRENEGGETRYPYFTHGDLSSSKSVIFIGGLTNGIGSIPYCPRVGESLKEIGWKFIQMHWSGAYEGYGTGSLDRDVLEMRSLVKHLRENGDTKIVIMGHSTGSQDVIHYLTSSIIPEESKVEGGIMQAPASDYESFVKKSQEGWNGCLREAEFLMMENRGDEILSEGSCKLLGMRMTAYRTWSLFASNGDDDYFSRHIPSEPDGKHPHPLSLSFGKLPVPALAICSSKDEDFQLGPPGPIIERWDQVADKYGRDLTTKIIIGSHDLVEEDATEELASLMADWVKRFDYRTEST